MRERQSTVYGANKLQSVTTHDISNVKDVCCSTPGNSSRCPCKKNTYLRPTNKYSHIQTALLAASTLLLESSEFCAHSLDSTTVLTTCLMTMKVWVKPFWAHLGDFLNLAIGYVVKQAAKIGTCVQGLQLFLIPVQHLVNAPLVFQLQQDSFLLICPWFKSWCISSILFYAYLDRNINHTTITTFPWAQSYFSLNVK